MKLTDLPDMHVHDLLPKRFGPLDASPALVITFPIISLAVAFKIRVVLVDIDVSHETEEFGYSRRLQARCPVILNLHQSLISLICLCLEGDWDVIRQIDN